MWRILCRIISVWHNIVMALNNVMIPFATHVYYIDLSYCFLHIIPPPESRICAILQLKHFKTLMFGNRYKYVCHFWKIMKKKMRVALLFVIILFIGLRRFFHNGSFPFLLLSLSNNMCHDYDDIYYVFKIYTYYLPTYLSEYLIYLYFSPVYILNVCCFITCIFSHCLYI